MSNHLLFSPRDGGALAVYKPLSLLIPQVITTEITCLLIPQCLLIPKCLLIPPSVCLPVDPLVPADPPVPADPAWTVQLAMVQGFHT